MSENGPKLFANKPKKSKLKQTMPITPPSPIKTASSPSPLVGAAAPPPPPPKKEPFFQRFKFPLPPSLERYRFLVPLVLFVNFTIGAYTLVRVTMRDKKASEEEIPDRSTLSTSTSAAPPAIMENPVAPAIIERIQRARIPEDQQRELFKWILEQRREVKPKDAEEKRRIDEEKAILKRFITKSLPL